MVHPIRTNSPLKVLTLGIGNDIKAEQQIRADIPHAQFYGADPINQSGYIYNQIGFYLQTAVGVKDGQLQASVLENGRYSTMTVNTTSFFNFTRALGLHVIDLLLVDNEGPEYDMMRLFSQENLLKEQITICQLNLELHGPLKNYGESFESYKQLTIEFLKNSPFVPLDFLAPINHARAMFINVIDEYCSKLYIGH